MEVGRGPVRTGVTAILPRGEDPAPVFASWYALNGCGEMTGAIWLEEVGLLTGPIMITNTLAVGTVADAVTHWWYHKPRPGFVLPVVAETYDGGLNDIRGGHVREEHAWAALDSAASGAVAEGNVGGGTGMRCHGFKGGIGTASRVERRSTPAEDGGLYGRRAGAGEPGPAQEPDHRGCAGGPRDRRSGFRPSPRLTASS